MGSDVCVRVLVAGSDLGKTIDLQCEMRELDISVDIVAPLLNRLVGHLALCTGVIKAFDHAGAHGCSRLIWKNCSVTLLQRKIRKLVCNAGYPALALYE